MPITPLSGVRSSWLTVAANSPLARADSSAWSRAIFSALPCSMAWSRACCVTFSCSMAWSRASCAAFSCSSARSRASAIVSSRFCSTSIMVLKACCMLTISRVPSSVARASLSPSCARRMIAERERIGTVRRAVIASRITSSIAESITATSRLARTISDCMLESVWRDMTRRTLPINSGSSLVALANGESPLPWPEYTGAAKVQSLLPSATSAGRRGTASASGCSGRVPMA